MGQFFAAAESGQRNLRVVLFIIILATLPFYCLGFVLWGAAPANIGGAGATSTPTLPPVTRSPTITFTPSPTLGFGPLATVTSFSPLQPTPRQFFPPGGVNPSVPLPTQFLSPTPFVVLPTSTSAPTLTPFPSVTPVPQATATTVPIFPTDTTVPIDSDAPPDGGSGNSPPPDSGGTGGNAPVFEDIAPIDADQPPTPTQEVEGGTS